MNFSWYINRAKSMTIYEILFYRLPQFFNTKIFFRINAFFFNSNKNRLVVNESLELPKYSIKEISNLFNNAPFSYNYSFFNTSIDISKKVNFRKDYKNNVDSKKGYSLSMNKQDKQAFGDIKYVFELSRLHFLPFFAFKAIHSNDKKVFDLINHTLKNWENENPYLKSINYTSGIEVGIRSLNIIFAHQILRSFNRLSESTDRVIKRLIYTNYHFLKNHLSLCSSGNNHLVGELLGLVVISTYFDDKTINKLKWKNKFLKLLEIKLLDDGVDDELSSRYHLTVTDHFLNGLVFLKKSGFNINDEILNRIKNSFEYIKYINFQSIDSNFGDNDNSFLINPYFDKNFSLSRSLLNSGAYFLDNKVYYNPLDFRNYLLFGDDIINAKKDAYQIDTRFFKNSGYAFLLNNKENLKLQFDIGDIGDKRLMAHGHSDQLSFTIQLNDEAFIIDPGTYQYHQTEIKWRNYFRSVHAHNTISVNKKNQATFLNRMGWCNPGKIINTDIKFSEDFDKVTATTDAYKSEGILFTRQIENDKSTNTIEIMDYLKIVDKQNNKNINFHLHFHPRISIVQKGNKILLISPKNKKIELHNELFYKAKIISGNKKKPFGWYSKSFDKIEKTNALQLELIIDSDMTLTTTIIY